jgi:hypothetical protein
MNQLSIVEQIKIYNENNPDRLKIINIDEIYELSSKKPYTLIKLRYNEIQLVIYERQEKTESYSHLTYEWSHKRSLFEILEETDEQINYYKKRK